MCIRDPCSQNSGVKSVEGYNLLGGGGCGQEDSYTYVSDLDEGDDDCEDPSRRGGKKSTDKRRKIAAACGRLSEPYGEFRGGEVRIVH